MGDAWKPPAARNHDGSIAFGDWRPVRDAIEAAQSAMGIAPTGNIDPATWNLVGLALYYHEFTSRPHCFNCQKQLRQFEVIRCLDCKASLCQVCAPGHFWPNGRPKREHPHG